MSDPSTGAQDPLGEGRPAEAPPSAYSAPVPPAAYGPPAPQPAYGAPPPLGYSAPPPLYYGQPAPFPKNGLAGWALALGIASLVLFLGFVAGVPAIIVGTQARRAAARGEANNASMATAGIVLGWIATALSVVVVLGLIALVAWGRNGDMHTMFTYRNN